VSSSVDNPGYASNPAKAREQKVRFAAIRAEQLAFSKRQLMLVKECGRRRCELCERPAKLQVWDERQHSAAALAPGRQPIWRICINQAECREARGLT